MVLTKKLFHPEHKKILFELNMQLKLEPEVVPRALLSHSFRIIDDVKAYYNLKIFGFQ